MPKSRTNWFRLNTLDETHQYLACRDGLYMYPAKETDLWSYVNAEYLKAFTPVDAKDVPLELRRSAASRRKKVHDPRVDEMLTGLLSPSRA